MARKSKYETHVKPHLEKIEEWTKAGATDKEIAQALGIAESTLYDYKNKYNEFSEALERARKNIVIEIKQALLKKALGYVVEDSRGIIEDGELKRTEVYRKNIPPDPTACAMLLRNYSDDWRDKDAVTNQYKQQELELKKHLAEINNFDF